LASTATRGAADETLKVKELLFRGFQSPKGGKRDTWQSWKLSENGVPEFREHL